MKTTQLLFLILITIFSACNTDVEKPQAKILGLSKINSSIYYNNPFDSIVEVNLETASIRNIAAVSDFSGLNESYKKAYSKKMNSLIYYSQNSIGIINLNTLTLKKINFDSDSTFVLIYGFEVIELNNTLMLFCNFYNYTEKTHSLGVVELDLQSAQIKSKTILMCFSIDNRFFTDKYEKQHLMFLVPKEVSEKQKFMYVYNYAQKQLSEYPFSGEFYDINYDSEKLQFIGISPSAKGCQLLTYSLLNNKTDTIGKLPETFNFALDMSYFDNASHTYYNGGLFNANEYLLVTINQSNATFSKTIKLRKYVSFIN